MKRKNLLLSDKEWLRVQYTSVSIGVVGALFALAALFIWNSFLVFVVVMVLAITAALLVAFYVPIRINAKRMGE